MIPSIRIDLYCFLAVEQKQLLPSHMCLGGAGDVQLCVGDLTRTGGSASARENTHCLIAYY